MMYSFDETKSTPLCEIMGRNKSDKGSVNITTSWHNYTTLYYTIFKNMTNNKLRIFELGIGTNNTKQKCNMGINGRPGASLYGWSEFFPNSQIFGADIDTNILFNADRIKTFYCDQTKPDVIEKMWAEPDLQENFDIIIDDGWHFYEANFTFFENSIHKLNSKGYYIIEDIARNDHLHFINKIKEWESKYTDCTFTLVNLPSKRNFIDNTLIVISKA